MTIVALGSMVGPALAAAELLAGEGISAGVTAVSCVSPPPVEDLLDALDAAPLALSVEAHYIIGGIGSLLAEVIAEHGLSCRLIRAGVRELPLGISGEPEYMHDQLGISPRRLADQVLAGARRAFGLTRPTGADEAVSGHRLLPRRASGADHARAARQGVRASSAADYEIIFVNDGSPDNAREVLAELAARDPHVVVINHARAFGSQSAFTSGMRIATGDGVVLLDGDLQDPPELIPQFVAALA